jgi:hypothetical protein
MAISNVKTKKDAFEHAKGLVKHHLFASSSKD